MKHLSLNFLILVFAISFLHEALCDEIRVATAANFVPTLNRLSAVFEKQTDHKIIVISGSTGKLTAQIMNGAPFDLFLSADQASVQAIASAGYADRRHEWTYATGRLAVLCKGEDLKNLSAEELLQSKTFRNAKHIAIAQPDSAPYGAAAKSWLNAAGVWKIVEPRVVYGESVSQVLQFVASGEATCGFVSKSQAMTVKEPQLQSVFFQPLPHQPLLQDAVLLKRAQNTKSANQFVAFLKSDKARKIIHENGYD